MNITIITVVYNSKNNINLTLDSIRRIKNKNIEYVVIDGESNDGTLDILNKNIDIIDVLISERDKGIYDAMNKGIENASGKYIAFLNAGDSYLDDFNESTSLIIKEYGDVFSFGINRFKQNNRPIYEPPTIIDLSKYDPQHMYLPHPGLLVSREVFDKIGKFNINFRSAADLDWVNRLILNYAYKVKIIDRPLVNFLEGGISDSINSFREARNISICYNKSLFSSNYKFFKQIIYYVLKSIKLNKCLRREY